MTNLLKNEQYLSLSVLKVEPFRSIWGNSPNCISKWANREFYLADDLHIARSLELFGTGMRGESILKFPPGKSLIIDPGISAPTPSNGADCIIRDLQMWSEEEWTTSEEAPFNPAAFDPPSFEGTSKGTPGILQKARATIQRVYILGFTGTGIYILAEGRSTNTNANNWRIHDVYIDSCGGHGIHVVGGEAQGGLCTGALIIAIGGSGIYEHSDGGNTYVGCYVFEVKGRGYSSTSGGAVSFIGCFAEPNELNHFPRGGVVWIGNSTGKGFTADTYAFIAEGFGNVHPFEVPNPNYKNLQFKMKIGSLSDPNALFGWIDKEGGDDWIVRWNEGEQIWLTENGRRGEDEERNVANYLTGNGYQRDDCQYVQGFPSILLGDALGKYNKDTKKRAPAPKPIKIEHSPTKPLNDHGEPGDIVYNSKQSDPSAPDYIPYVGWICVGVGPAREWKPFGKIET